ncbi:unnamed protein product [Parascedosporium putredinis]|uniref:Uncharacterized protein n=1 Tax=Parascedosporium putredinis TaxID=1442378 RepID=A0A9P1HAE9_9PEZI|nr:unnamed protein product [Parascedosporium putredinis]CAI8001781.1 unnamed protein product [Parascedosporium putredinis]
MMCTAVSIIAITLTTAIFAIPILELETGGDAPRRACGAGRVGTVLEALFPVLAAVAPAGVGGIGPGPAGPADPLFTGSFRDGRCDARVLAGTSVFSGLEVRAVPGTLAIGGGGTGPSERAAALVPGVYGGGGCGSRKSGGTAGRGTLRAGGGLGGSTGLGLRGFGPTLLPAPWIFGAGGHRRGTPWGCGRAGGRYEGTELGPGG